LRADVLDPYDQSLGWLYYSSDKQTIVVDACADGPIVNDYNTWS